jgi:hypothetical protein
MYGIQLVHQDPLYARHDKKEPLWLRTILPVTYADERGVDWDIRPAGARSFATLAEAQAAQPAPWLVTTKVVKLP